MLSTRAPDKIYKYLITACKLHAEKFFKKKLFLRRIKISKFPSFKFLSYFIFFILSGKIFYKANRLNVCYSEVNIGRFILGSVFTDFKSYTSKYIYFFNYLKYFYTAGKFINTGEKLLNENNFHCIYIDHCGAMNGVLFTLLAKKKIVYTNNYPRNIFASKVNISSFNGEYEDRLKINKTKKYLDKKSQKRAAKVLKKLSQNPEIIPWMSGTNFNSLKKIPNIKSYEYIIYTHSFTDGQLWFGNDGFENSLDWLLFTLDNLKARNKKTLIKCHP